MTTINEVYTDIDVSLEKNNQKDFPKIININAIRKALYNRIMISAEELPFDNSESKSVREFIHSDNSEYSKNMLYELIDRAVSQDDRLTNTDIQIKTQSTIDGVEELVVTITANVNYANGLRQEVDFTIILDNY